jgi:hypothetical protein
MDLNNMRGNKKDRGRGPDGRSSRPGSEREGGDDIDMSPGGGYARGARPGARPGSPKSIQDTQAWQSSQAGLANMWGNYRRVLKTSWQKMPRSDQEALITRLCQIVTIGVSVLVLMFFYGFLPKVIAIFAVPGVLVGSFWAGTKVVAPIIAAQYDQYLNKEF